MFNPQHKKIYTLWTEEKMNVNKMIKSLQYINVELIIKKDKKNSLDTKKQVKEQLRENDHHKKTIKRDHAFNLRKK